MASASAQDINQSSHQCGICLEPLNNNRELPCHHLFCKECLTRWARTNTTHDNILTCPNCRQSAQIPTQGIAGFPTLVRSIQETGTMAEATQEIPQIMCDNCEQPDKTASVYCQKCKHYLCDTCQNIHGAWKAMKHHKFVALADMPQAETSTSTAEDKCCSEHDMKKTSFCKTCDKLVCKDCVNSVKHCQGHDITTMKEAAETKMEILKERKKKCEKKKQECQDAVEKIEKIEAEVYGTGYKIIQGLNRKKAYYNKQVKDVFGTIVGDVERVQEEQTRKLTDMKYSLKGKITEIDEIQDQDDNLLATGSDYNIASMSTSSMSQSLKKISKMHINEVDEKQYQFPTTFPTPVFTYEVDQAWKQIGCIPVSNAGRGIAVTSDDKIAVSNTVYSLSGGVMHRFDAQPSSESVDCVCITSSDAYILVKSPSPPFYIGKKVCQTYDREYVLQHEFKPTANDSGKSEIKAVTVDQHGSIILGFCRSAHRMSTDKDIQITIHSSDGNVRARFKPSALQCTAPHHLAVTSKEEIIVSDGNTIQLLDYTGKCLHVVQPPTQVTEWKPSSVCCDKNNYVHVSNSGQPKCIYKYANGRLYMGRVTAALNEPKQITLSHDGLKLFVGDIYDQKGIVKIFQAQ